MSLFQYSGIAFKIGLFFLCLLFPDFIFSQIRIGKVYSKETSLPIGYVNIGIVGKNTGTVTDLNGNYSLNLNPDNSNDYLRFSVIGYQSKTYLISQFLADSVQDVYLETRTYTISEVKIVHHKLKETRLGNLVFSNQLKSGFASNSLGAELGIRLNVRRQVVLTKINLNVSVCTFDSVTYRLNIYQIENQSKFRNILTTPIFISFRRDIINDILTFDLKKYSVSIQGEVLIALELYKDLGEGKLFFNTTWFTGKTFHRQTSEGDWIESPGAIGMYLNGLVIK